MSNKDYYKILGIPQDASIAEIKKAYRKLALKYHPDRVKPADKKQAEEKFKELSEAYYVLSDKQRRQEYDDYRRGGVHGFQGGDFAQAHGFDFDEILRHFRGFSGASQRSSGGGFYSGIIDGDDIVDIFDHMGAAQGAAHYYSFGSDGNFQKRPSIREETTDIIAKLQVPPDLLRKGGEAKFNHDGKEITLKIKPGMRHGQRLRLRGQGKMCSCCRHRGDLIVEVE